MQFNHSTRKSPNLGGDCMISEEDKQKYAEAVKCSTCKEWHKHCNAECCRLIFLNIDPKELDGPGKLFTIKPESLELSDQRYYRIHDVEYLRGFLRFKKERIIVVGRKVIYIHNCKFLKNNLCEGHPDNTPELCRALTLETAKLAGQHFELTDNCLFKYKSKEVKING